MLRLDVYLDEHPRLDDLYVRALGVWLKVRWAVPSWRAERKWKPGMFYLDHGSHPCVLVSIDDGTLTGVSLVTGRLIGGCSIYHCGPVPTTWKDAVAKADEMRVRDE